MCVCVTKSIGWGVCVCVCSSVSVARGNGGRPIRDALLCVSVSLMTSRPQWRPTNQRRSPVCVCVSNDVTPAMAADQSETLSSVCVCWMTSRPQWHWKNSRAAMTAELAKKWNRGFSVPYRAWCVSASKKKTFGFCFFSVHVVFFHLSLYPWHWKNSQSALDGRGFPGARDNGTSSSEMSFRC